MNFLIMISIVSVFSFGVLVLTLETAPRLYRLSVEKRFGTAFLRQAFLKAAEAAGRSVSAFRSSKKEELVCKELYSALSILRNHASADEAGAGACVTTDHILEQFAQTESVLAKCYAGALRLLRTGRRAEAVEYFTAAAGVELARDFILLILDWDAAPPHKLKKTVGAFQNALRETRTTMLIHRNEVLSDLVYLPVVACVMVIFINFIYVAYFAEQSALLSELFFRKGIK